MFTRALTLIALSALTLPLLAADEGPTYRTPDEAGPDYVIQGEYLGEVDADNGRGRGAQVIALARANSHSWATREDFPARLEALQSPRDGRRQDRGNVTRFQADECGRDQGRILTCLCPTAIRWETEEGDS